MSKTKIIAIFILMAGLIFCSSEIVSAPCSCTSGSQCDSTYGCSVCTDFPLRDLNCYCGSRCDYNVHKMINSYTGSRDSIAQCGEKTTYCCRCCSDSLYYANCNAGTCGATCSKDQVDTTQAILEPAGCNACQKLVCNNNNCLWGSCQSDIYTGAGHWGGYCCWQGAQVASSQLYPNQATLCSGGTFYSASAYTCSQIGSYYSDGTNWQSGTAEGSSCGTCYVCRSGSCVSSSVTYYKDFDSDTYGNATNTYTTCAPKPPDYVTNSNDCNDNNAAIKPGATELCDGINNDCVDNADGSGEAVSTHLCAKQSGVCAGSVKTCGGALGWLACTDANYTSYNSSYQSPETNCTDGKDNDCDGLTDIQDTDCDKTNPTIQVSYSPSSPKSREAVNINASATDTQSGLKNISIYVDDMLKPVKNCTIAPISPCNASVYYNKTGGPHPYRAVVYDNAGNFNESLGSFNVSGDPGKTCAENNNNEGDICEENEFCIYPGIFTVSNDSKDGRCCSTSCVSGFALPKCDAPPINGVQYAPSLFSCPGQIIQAEVENENLSCCLVTPGSLLGTGEIYWSRQNSGYFKLTEAAEGDSLYCIVSGISGTNVIFEVTKPSGTGPKDPQSIGTDGIAKSSPVLADEIGTYTCAVEGIAEPAEITVTEAGANPTTLPFFGIIQLLAALSFILAYSIFKKQ